MDTQAKRRFFLPALGMVALFGLLGPAVGGAVFIPVAMTIEAGTDAAPHLGWIAGLIGHAYALIPAYVLGLAPAMLTGLCYALYDAWAPSWSPRALGAALIGALFAHLVYVWLVWAAHGVSVILANDFGDGVSDVVDDWTTGEFDVGLYRALLFSGAASGLACAMAAQLLRLDFRRT